MSFEVNKIIPVVGHTRILQDLAEQIKNHVLPHGLLLIGPKGVGKSTLAFQLISTLFKGVNLDIEMTSEDPMHRRLIHGSHADFKHIQLKINEEGKAQQEIPLELVREVVQFLQTTPLEGGWRIVLIEDADCLGRKAANALLKSLEEPPPKTLLILCASQEQQVLPTLRSRCHRIVLKRLTDEEVRKVLRKYPNIPADELELLTMFAEGSPGRAMMLWQLGGKQFYQEFLDVLQSSIKGQFTLLVPFIEKYTQTQPDKSFDPYRAIGYFISWWLGRYLLKIGQNEDDIFKLGDTQLKSQIFKRFPFKFWEQHYHKINFFYHHPQIVGLERKYCLAVIMLGFVFGPKAYNEGIENEFR
ncbi:MAG: DNA polymerase III subunit [Candidatus Paracaedimonas acanthamoebae]|uniref:DNA polymerase III subunit n=1 Tax=Candidatus Paracaedimonas acanthamoebae TaxID=244581 RepID=A0A8J7TSW3_9PROT|nr:DNA polymerase III subunit [Candidatus Paracaedimonas acanthamoebae]